MTAFVRIGLAIAAAACIAGCATPPTTTPSAVVASPQAKTVAADRASAAVVIGKSTKADVAAVLGETLVIRFDNGFEVWVYRLAGSAPALSILRMSSDRAKPGAGAEFVILFAPSGVVAKTRIRPAPQQQSGG